MIDLTHSVSLALDRLVCPIAFFMTYTCSYDYEIMQLPFTGGTLCVLPNITTQLGDYKGALQVSPKVLVELAYFEIRTCHSDRRRGISGTTL